MNSTKTKLCKRKIDEHFADIKAQFLHCPECSCLAEFFDRPAIHLWAVRFICSCRRDWLVCIVCCKQRKHCVSTRQISDHASKCRDKVNTNPCPLPMTAATQEISKGRDRKKENLINGDFLPNVYNGSDEPFPIGDGNDTEDSSLCESNGVSLYNCGPTSHCDSCLG